MGGPAEIPTILYCAKHPVNFAMFEPVYEHLQDDPDIRIAISTGRYRSRPVVGWIDPREPDLTNEKILGMFDIRAEHLIKTSCHDKKAYEVYCSSNGDLKMRPPKSLVSVQIFHGVSFRNFAVNENVLEFNKLFFPGPYHVRRYIADGLLKEGDPRIELIGMPKIDCLVDGSIRRDDVLRGMGLDPGLPCVCWCPTGAEHNSFDKYGKAAVDAVAAAGCSLILKLHDHPHLPKGLTPADIQEEARSMLGPNARLGTYPNVAPYLVAADLLISDASSVAYEYTVRDRPIIFLDVPELLGERAAMEGSKMDLETHGRKCGRIVGDARELAAAIREEFGAPARFSAQRRATANDIFHQPGTATERMAKRLKELAGSG